MADGRKKNGGARRGAGRKSKAKELGLVAMVDSVWTIPNQKKVIKQLAEDCLSGDFKERHEARKLLLAYKFGKPTNSLELTGKDREPIQTEVILPKMIELGD